MWSQFNIACIIKVLSRSPAVLTGLFIEVFRVLRTARKRFHEKCPPSITSLCSSRGPETPDVLNLCLETIASQQFHDPMTVLSQGHVCSSKPAPNSDAAVTAGARWHALPTYCLNASQGQLVLTFNSMYVMLYFHVRMVLPWIIMVFCEWFCWHAFYQE